MTNRMLDRQELADHFKVSVATVDRWIRDGVPCMKPSTRVVRFDLAEVLEWAKAGKAESKAVGVQLDELIVAAQRLRIGLERHATTIPLRPSTMAEAERKGASNA